MEIRLLWLFRIVDCYRETCRIDRCGARGHQSKELLYGNAGEGALMMICNDVPPRTSIKPVAEPLLDVRKSEVTETAKSHAIRTMLIFYDLRIMALDGK